MAPPPSPQCWRAPQPAVDWWGRGWALALARRAPGCAARKRRVSSATAVFTSACSARACGGGHSGDVDPPLEEASNARCVRLRVRAQRRLSPRRCCECAPASPPTSPSRPVVCPRCLHVPPRCVTYPPSTACSAFCRLCGYPHTVCMGDAAGVAHSPVPLPSRAYPLARTPSPRRCLQPPLYVPIVGSLCRTELVCIHDCIQYVATTVCVCRP